MLSFIGNLSKEAKALSSKLVTAFLGEGEDISVKCEHCGAMIIGKEFDSKFKCQYCDNIIINDVDARKKEKLNKLRNK